jgi:hypothetical protein
MAARNFALLLWGGIVVAVVGLIVLSDMNNTTVPADTAGWAFVTAAAHAENRAIPKQKHPAGCRDHQCVRAWYDEYKSGVLAELRQWQSFEQRAVSAAGRHDARDASRMMDEAVRAGWYIHVHWSTADSAEIAAAGIAVEEWDALASCRTAIIEFKWLLIAISSSSQGKIDQGRADYAEALGKCRERFKD